MLKTLMPYEEGTLLDMIEDGEFLKKGDRVIVSGGFYKIPPDYLKELPQQYVTHLKTGLGEYVDVRKLQKV